MEEEIEVSIKRNKKKKEKKEKKKNFKSHKALEESSERNGIRRDISQR